MPQKPRDEEGTRTPRQLARARVERVRQAGASLLQGGNVAAVRTRRGDVMISKIVPGEDAVSTWVDVTVAGETRGGDPNFRIVNPPTLVRDPQGDVILQSGTFREDPIAAIAEVIATHGGAQSSRKGRRKR